MNFFHPWIGTMMVGIFMAGGVAGYASHWWIGRRERAQWLREQGWK